MTQVQIKLTLNPKIRIAMTNDKSVSTNFQSSESSDLQDDMTQEAITRRSSIKFKQLGRKQKGQRMGPNINKFSIL